MGDKWVIVLLDRKMQWLATVSWHTNEKKNPIVAEAILLNLLNGVWRRNVTEMLHDQRIAEKPEFVVAPFFEDDFLLIIVLGFLRYISSWTCILDHLYVWVKSLLRLLRSWGKCGACSSSSYWLGAVLKMDNGHIRSWDGLPWNSMSSMKYESLWQTCPLLPTSICMLRMAFQKWAWMI